MYTLYDKSIDFNKLLKQLRLDTGLTTTKLGEISGISRCMISYIENGHRQPTAFVLNCLLMSMGHRLAVIEEE